MAEGKRGRHRKIKSEKTRITDESSFTARANTVMQRMLEETVYKKPMKKELHIFLQDLIKMYSPTGQEKPVVDYCNNVLRSAGFKTYSDTVNNLFAVRGNVPGARLVCINAHTDTVQTVADQNVADYVSYLWEKDIYTGNGKMIGGDDKCGIAVALTLATQTDLPMKIILTAGEERGGIGSGALIKSDFSDVVFCFTIDRRGGEDLISEYCGRVCAPQTFVDQFINLVFRNIGLKFKTEEGSYADTYTICEFTPCVNLSAGYYNAHTAQDFIDVTELYDVMIAVKLAIENVDELISAIDRSGTDWFKDKHANDPDYKRGKYIGRTYYVDSYGYPYNTAYRDDSFWYGSGANRELPKSAQRPLTLPVPADDRPFTTRKEDEESNRKKLRENLAILTGQKCHIYYDKVAGRDDKTPTQTTVEEHVDHSMTLHEGVLLASYNDGRTPDDIWDRYLRDGEIRPFVYHIGIRSKVKVNNDRLREDIRRANCASEDAVNVPIHYDKNALDNFEGLYEDSRDAIRGEEERPEVDSVNPASWAIEDAIELDAAEELIDVGRQSGYLPGSTEYGIFVDYVTGNIAIDELTNYLDTQIIEVGLYNAAIEGRRDYQATLRLKRLQKTYQQPPVETKKKKTSKTTVHGYRFTDDEKKIITDHAIGRTSDKQIDSMEWFREITSRVLAAAREERMFFEKYGKLSGNYTVDDDALSYTEGKSQKREPADRKWGEKRTPRVACQNRAGKYSNGNDDKLEREWEM